MIVPFSSTPSQIVTTATKPTSSSSSTIAAAATTTISKTADSLGRQQLSVQDAQKCLAELTAVFVGTAMPTRRRQRYDDNVINQTRQPFPTAPRLVASSSSSSDDDDDTSSAARSVRFGTLSVREYDVSISDHPGCSCGPPIQLGWTYRQGPDWEVGAFDDKRQCQRRPWQELLLSKKERKYLLKYFGGYTKRDIARSVKEVQRVQRQRRVTSFWMPANRWNENIDDAVTSVKSVFGLV